MSDSKMVKRKFIKGNMTIGKVGNKRQVNPGDVIEISEANAKAFAHCFEAPRQVEEIKSKK